MTAKRASPPSERMKKYRARKRAAGLKPMQLWAYDTKSPAFRRELRRQLKEIRRSPEEKKILDWIETVSDWPE